MMYRSFNLRIPDNPRLSLALLLQLIHESRYPFFGLLGRRQVPLDGDVQDVSLPAIGREQGEGEVEPELVDGEILTHRYCCCRDGNQQDCEKSYLQELLKIGLFHFVPSGGPISV